MTSNPASDLAALLLSWNGNAQSSISLNRANALDTSPGTLEYWVGIDRAVILLDHYRQLIDAIEARGQDVEHYREQLVRLHAYVYAPDNQWSASQSGAGITKTDHAQLLMAADGLQGRFLGTGQPDADEVVARLREADEAVDDLPASADRERLRWMIDQAITFASDIGRFGSETVVATAGEVAQVFGGAAEAEDDLEKRARFQAIKDGLVVAIIGGLSTEAGKFGLNAAGGVVAGILGG